MYNCVSVATHKNITIVNVLSTCRNVRVISTSSSSRNVAVVDNLFVCTSTVCKGCGQPN